MYILIVEDEPLIAMHLADELQFAGHDIVGPAASIETALNCAHLQQVDLALLDIDLQHKGDGLVLAKRLHEMHIPALFVSGQAGKAHEHAELVLGYISKPYDAADIVQSVAVVDALVHGQQPPPPALPSSLELFH
jgi:DNA-binding response OmpR family regulator